MAKFGEGDPRWLVADREDGTNVNNWHWTEFNCTPWAQDYIKDAFKDVVFVDSPEYFIKVTKVEELKGECTVSCRKGKIICFYELELKFKWEGEVLADKKVLQGSIYLPSLDTDDDDPEMNVSTEGSTKNDQKLRSVVISHGLPKVKTILNEFTRVLKEEHAQKVLKQVPGTTKSSAAASAPNTSNTSANSTSNTNSNTTNTTTTNTTSASTATSSSSSRRTKTVKVEVGLENTGVAEVWDVLTSSQRMSISTQSPCRLEPTPGGSFAYFNGQIVGTFESLEAKKKIVQKWRKASWPSDWPSTVVTITLSPSSTRKDTIILKMEQSCSLPQEAEDEVEKLEAAWIQNFFRPMKMMNGWGSSLDMASPD